MREIKFRAWDKNINEMFSHEELVDEFVMYGQFFSNQENSHFVVMQYTGLKDKNGKEIYDEDILRLQDETNKLHYYQVKYVENLFVLDGELAVHIKSAYFKEREVIGNIYENKELLNE